MPLPYITSVVGQTAVLETSSGYELGNSSEVSIAMQVAFIITGMHTTYYITSKHALGIDVVNWYNFQSTIEMYPVVKSMVDKMCEDAKDDM